MLLQAAARHVALDGAGTALRMCAACLPLVRQLSSDAMPGQCRRWVSASAAATAPKLDALFLSHASPAGSITPLSLGLYNYFERHIPLVGFFMPIGTTPIPPSIAKLDHHVDLIHSVFGLQGDPASMVGVTDLEAAKLIAARQQADLLDRIFSAYATYRADKKFVLVQGPGPHIGATELDAIVAQALNTPVLLALAGDGRMTANDYFNLAMLKRQVFADHKVDVVGVALNQVPAANHAVITAQLADKFQAEGLAFAGAIPQDKVMGSARLTEVGAALGANLVFGQKTSLDKEFSDVIVASQRIEELLELLEERGNDATAPLIITSQDRMDIVLGLLASQVSILGPTVSGVVLTKAGHALENRRYSKDMVARIFSGIENTSQLGVHLPVMLTDKSIYDVLDTLRKLVYAPTLVPSSTRKITQAKMLFDRHIDVPALLKGLPEAERSGSVMTPKIFMHNLKALCKASPQRIVLPESSDPRVLTAAAEVTQRGLAKVTLLGVPAVVLGEARKLGLDMTGVTIHDPQTSPYLDKYTDVLTEARKKKGLHRSAAYDMVKGDMNMFGVMMVACGDADGMVSGAIHTTAATIRPAMQVLRGGDNTVVSSVFFMCLPDKVLVYGDCAVNPTPSAPELAQIAIVSADTAAAFGVEPRVAMLSYSTLGSGAGPDVQKVTQAVAAVKQLRPDLKVEGPIQYDAAIDPKVAAVKIKTASEVAGKATVFIFPDLNTGNNTYKAVQQASGAIAMGPVMQGLTKPVNDLSRGCTVPDIVNTICVTSIQAMQSRTKEAAAAAAAA